MIVPVNPAYELLLPHIMREESSPYLKPVKSPKGVSISQPSVHGPLENGSWIVPSPTKSDRIREVADVGLKFVVPLSVYQGDS